MPAASCVEDASLSHLMPVRDACAILAFVNSQTLTLPDGQVVELIVSGDEPNLLVYHHGTPAAGRTPSSLLAAAQSHGFKVVEIVRPGYGASTRQPGRSVADVVRLVCAAADALGHERFVTVGWSGGGPHALATAALAPERCVAALSLAGIAPFDAAGLDFLDGMGQDNIDEFGAALAGANELQEYLTAAAAGLRDVTGADLVAALGSLLPDVDRVHLSGQAGEELAEQLRFSVANGIWGWFDDDIAFTTPWGFDVANAHNAEIWQGSADLMVPFAHGQWLASHVSNARVELMNGEGHLSLAESAFSAVVQRFSEVLAR